MINPPIIGVIRDKFSLNSFIYLLKLIIMILNIFNIIVVLYDINIEYDIYIKREILDI